MEDVKEVMLMLTIEGLIAVIGLCIAVFSLGYEIGSKNAKK